MAWLNFILTLCESWKEQRAWWLINFSGWHSDVATCCRLEGTGASKTQRAALWVGYTFTYLGWQPIHPWVSIWAHLGTQASKTQRATFISGGIHLLARLATYTPMSKYMITSRYTSIEFPKSCFYQWGYRFTYLGSQPIHPWVRIWTHLGSFKMKDADLSYIFYYQI